MAEYVDKYCKIHGLSRAIFTKGNHARCIKCRNQAVKDFRIRTKGKLIKEFGGCCKICGYDRYQGALEFHHIDPKTKSFTIADAGKTHTFENALKEARKCILICANCHREIEAGITNVVY